MNVKNDRELFDIMAQELFSAVIADALDTIGARNQILRHDIRPIYKEAVLVGRAKTVLSVDVYDIPEEPYKMELKAVDSLESDQVLVVQTNGSTRSSFWGELLSTAARVRGARGAVIDGFTRDTLAIIEMKFPVFVRGIAPYDSNGRSDVIAYDVPIQCGDVTVNPGDIIFGDYDGLVVIPRDIESQVIDIALEKARGEKLVKQALEDGMSVTEAFEKYGIL